MLFPIKPAKRDLILFLACFVLYGMHRLLRSKVDYIFLRCYFNDLLAGVAFPAYLNISLCYVNQRVFQLHQLLLLMFAVGCFWEFVAPIYVPYATTDVYDLVAYCCGAFIYWITESILSAMG